MVRKIPKHKIFATYILHSILYIFTCSYQNLETLVKQRLGSLLSQSSWTETQAGLSMCRVNTWKIHSPKDFDSSVALLGDIL